MRISIIAAVSQNGVIGRNDKIPWHLPADLRHFREITMGHCILMGRKTYNSIGHPLQGRTNIIVSRNPNLSIEGCVVVSSFEKGIEVASRRKEKELMVIGGAQIFALALLRTNRIYLTRVHASFEGDSYFPTLNPSQWKESSCQEYAVDEQNPYAFTTCVLEAVRI